MGPGTDTATPLFRKNTLDEMTVGRTEKPMPGKLPQKPRAPSSPLEGEDSSPQEAKPIGEANLVRGPTTPGDPRPIIRAKSGAGSYEDAGDAKRQKRTKGKTGRPGR